MKRVGKSVPNVPLFKAVKKGASFEEKCIAYCKRYTLYYHIHKEQYRRYDEEHTIEEFTDKSMAIKSTKASDNNYKPRYEFPDERTKRDLLMDHEILLNDYPQDMNYHQDGLFTDEINFSNIESEFSVRKAHDELAPFTNNNEEDKFNDV